MNCISLHEAMIWMARLAATDGVITPTERKVLSEFAKSFDLDASKILRWAYGFAKGVDLPEVERVERNKMKGRLFEQFVVSLLGAYCRLLAWRSDKIVGGTYAAENLLPDLLIRHRFDFAEVEYFVECKYRSAWNEKGCIDLGHQYVRYHKHAKEHGKELFIALGVGGSPSAPDDFLLIPGRLIGYDHLIERTSFIKCLCGKSPDCYHKYISHFYLCDSKTSSKTI